MRVMRLFALILLALVEVAIAQTPPVSAPTAVQDKAKKNIIDESNLQQFRSLLVPELYPLVKQGMLQLNRQDALPTKWQLDGRWDKGGVAESSAFVAALAGGKPSPDFKLPPGFPFAQTQGLASGEGDSAKRILWNVAAAFWNLRSIQIDWDIREVRDDKETVRYKASFTRVYPLALDSEKRPAQLFRELLKFKAPPAASSLSYLTFRFLQSEEDFLWTVSPAIGKARQLSGTTRGDPIGTLPASLDDLLGWSGNIHLVQADLSAEREFLLPFPAAMSAVLQRTSADEKDNLCHRVDTSSLTFVEWNLDTTKLAGASWQPVSAVYVPRTAWRLELSSRDPYSLVGRQILYIDKEAVLPLVNIVFDRAGKLWKLVLSGFGIAEGGNLRAPYQAFSVVYDFREDKAALFAPTSISYCDTLPPGMSFGDFDPSRIAPQKPKEVSTVKPKEQKKGQAEEPQDERVLD